MKMATKKKVSKKAAHGTGVGALAVSEIEAGKTNAQVLALIEKKFPESKLGMGGVSWYRNKLRKENVKIKTNRELVAALNKPAKKKAA